MRVRLVAVAVVSVRTDKICVTVFSATLPLRPATEAVIEESTVLSAAPMVTSASVVKRMSSPSTVA